MSLRGTLALLSIIAALTLPASALGAHSVGSHSVGSATQIAWVRSAATRFVTAELTDNGSGACAVLNAPLRAAEHGRTCTQRWDAKLAKLAPVTRAKLRSQKHEIASAIVIVHGDHASLELPSELMSGPNRFYWTENCWMLMS
jgi:hypothetical protein